MKEEGREKKGQRGKGREERGEAKVKREKS